MAHNGSLWRTFRDPPVRSTPALGEPSPAAARHPLPRGEGYKVAREGQLRTRGHGKHIGLHPAWSLDKLRMSGVGSQEWNEKK